MPRSAHEVADLIDRLKLMYVGSTTALMLLNDPALPQMLAQVGFDPGSKVSLGRHDNTSYEGLDFWASMEASRGSGFNRDFMGTWISVMVSWIGDALDQGKLYDNSREFQFFRHLRNAVSHGNRWHFKSGEPGRPAEFGSFTLDASLHGQVGVLFAYLGAGDVFDLLDHIAAALRKRP